MKNLITLFSMLLLFFIASSCETQTVNDETGIDIDQFEIYEVDPNQVDRSRGQSYSN
ncbi:hypothetical protein [Aquimarina sp. I32.4]|uniref:hypothetical protein n=1 Tax=Aquimarina sp. I32.4 TaxID=2053903 RepID=UPI001304FEF2|nr:hypothetical protein [Aquimarina sp. I32.4]